MLRTIRQFWALAWMTALEAIRQPLALLILACSIGFVSLLPFALTHTLGEEGKLVRDSALALHFVGGLLLGSYAASATLRREIERGTAAAVLSKPVGRATFFVAKYAGIALVMIIYSADATLATLLAAQAGARPFVIDGRAAAPLLATVPFAFLLAGLLNYFAKRPFVSSAFRLLSVALGVAFVTASVAHGPAKGAPLGAAMPWQLLAPSVLIALAILVLSGVAAGLAPWLDAVPTFAACAAIFLLGLMSDYLFGRHAPASRLAAFLYAVLPNWQHFWAADALMDGGRVPWGYVLQAAVYAAWYLAAVLTLGMLGFRRLEVRG